MESVEVTSGGGEEGRDACGFDATTLDWECFPNEPSGKYLPEIDVDIRPYDAIVFDRINERLVFIGGSISAWGPGEPEENMTFDTFDDVWSLDPETGEWLELLAPSQ